MGNASGREEGGNDGSNGESGYLDNHGATTDYPGRVGSSDSMKVIQNQETKIGSDSRIWGKRNVAVGRDIDKFMYRFNVYVPDLIVCGDSYTTCTDRIEGFQARCLMGALKSWEVSKMSVVGVSYGGFVGHLDEKPQLVIIKRAGHAVNVEKPKKIYKHIKEFLVDPKQESKDDGNKVDDAKNSE
ncbi:hypothetical protein QQ045_007250 [Rhodiola kirilowii]